MEGQLSSNELNDFMEAFRLFDINGDGRITVEELGTVMRVFGQVLTESELGETIRHLDGDGNGTIEFEEFVRVMMQPANKANSWEQAEEEVRKAFCAFDKDQNGFISSEELFHVMKSLGEIPSKEEVQDMIRQADKDGDGFINYSEFFNMMMTGNF